MLVGMWMRKEVVTVTTGESLSRAAQLMALRRIRHLPVVDAAGRPVGLISSTDVFHAAPLSINPFSAVGMDPLLADDAGRLSVGDVMSADLVTITADAPIEAAAATMHDRKIGALPVVRHGELAGLLTQSDILRAFTEMLAVRSAGARITFDTAEEEDVVPLLATLTAKHQLRLISLMSLQREGRSYCIARIAGTAVDELLEELWRSHHRIESVVRAEPQR